MEVIIDRFEGDFAICEKADRTMLNIPRSNLPPQAKEGDVLTIEGDSIALDTVATALRKKSVDETMRGLWK
jgi:hypothetical protein